VSKAWIADKRSRKKKLSLGGALGWRGWSLCGASRLVAALDRRGAVKGHLKKSKSIAREGSQVLESRLGQRLLGEKGVTRSFTVSENGARVALTERTWSGPIKGKNKGDVLLRSSSLSASKAGHVDYKLLLGEKANAVTQPLRDWDKQGFQTKSRRPARCIQH